MWFMCIKPCLVFIMVVFSVMKYNLYEFSICHQLRWCIKPSQVEDKCKIHTKCVVCAFVFCSNTTLIKYFWKQILFGVEVINYIYYIQWFIYWKITLMRYHIYQVPIVISSKLYLYWETTFGPALEVVSQRRDYSI